MNLAHTIAGTLLGASLACTAHAQALVDRKILAVSIIPNDSGVAAGDSFFDIVIDWTVGIEPTSVPVDASTVLMVFKNGTEVPIMTSLVGVQVDGGSGICGFGGCSGGCGGGYIDGVFNTMLCLQDPPGCPAGNCDCGCTFPSIKANLGSDPFEAGDEIVVMLFAASGAAPEPSGTNHVWSTTFDGVPHYRERRIESVDVVPSAGGRGGMDVLIGGSTTWHGLHTASDLGFEIEVIGGDGSVLASKILPGIAQPAGDPLACGGVGCGGLCGFWNGIQVSCDAFPNIWFLPCVCGGGWLANFPGLDPNALVGAKVILKPLPGALPTLPGFGDEEGVPVPLPCVGDLDGDGTVGGADLTILLGAWGTPGPGDFNNDGTVNGADLATLLAEWGPCIDV